MTVMGKLCDASQLSNSVRKRLAPPTKAPAQSMSVVGDDLRPFAVSDGSCGGNILSRLHSARRDVILIGICDGCSASLETNDDRVIGNLV